MVKESRGGHDIERVECARGESEGCECADAGSASRTIGFGQWGDSEAVVRWWKRQPKVVLFGEMKAKGLCGQWNHSERVVLCRGGRR